MSQGEEVQAVRSQGSDCAGWCGRSIQHGAPAIRVTFKLNAVFVSVPVDRELCQDCGTRLHNNLGKALHALKGRRG